MTPSKVAMALDAMKILGIPSQISKPVLKKILKLYDNNWELIEQENYRVLADSIFEEQSKDYQKEAHLRRDQKKRPRLMQNQPEVALNSSIRSNKTSSKCTKVRKLTPLHPHSKTTSQQSDRRPDLVLSQIGTITNPSPDLFSQDGGYNTLIKTKRKTFSGIVLCGNPDVITHSSNWANRSASNNDGLYENGETLNCTKETEVSLMKSTGKENKSFHIASTKFGEVKLYLTCTRSVLDSECHIPTLDKTMNLLEEKLLRSYKIILPKSSILKTMKELCECFVTLGSANAIGIEPCMNKDLSHNFPNAKSLAIARKGCSRKHTNMEESSSSGTSISSYNNDMRPLVSSFQSLDGFRNSKPKLLKTEQDLNVVTSELKSSDLHYLQKCQPSCSNVRSYHYVHDITKGQEKIPISLVNDNNLKIKPSIFYYIAQNTVYQNAYLNFSLARIGDEDCCSSCFGNCLSSPIPCACASETGGEFAYTAEGLLKKEFLDECISMNHAPEKHYHIYCKKSPSERSMDGFITGPCKGHLIRKFIKECWNKCGCNKLCGNRVVQRGITCNLQVFFISETKGWGVRTLESLPRGAFVCEYVGEVLTNMELYDRNVKDTGKEKHTYPVLLDADWASEGVLEDEEALCLDATIYGNVARFINHRCFDANLVEIPVAVETPDHHYYHLAFFTTREVDAMEELTWDYGIDFEDHNHPVKAFKCLCGSKFCKDVKPKNARH